MILEGFKKTIKRYGLLKKNDRVIVGVSGGPDSLALLYLLKALEKEFNLKLHIAHLDHMLRSDSAKDAQFVQALAQKLKIPSTIERVNVKELAKKGSLEEVARNIRFFFLFKLAKRINADKIALGHNFDDQAETVLMRILRGAGLSGLSGILPKRRIYGHTIIRPLIEIQRREIEAFLKKRGISARIDKSNLTDIYFRNKIRNKLLPLLGKSYNKNIKEILSNTAQSAAYDYDYLNQAAIKAVRRFKSKINLKDFLRLHPAIQRLALRLKIARLKGNTRRITFVHIREIEDLILNRPAGSVVDLPQGLSVAKEKTYFYFYKK